MASILIFTQTLLRAIKAFQLYAPGHPRHREFMTSLEETTRQFMEGRNEIQIGALHDRLFLDKQMEDIDQLPLRTLARLLEERAIRILVLYPGITGQELGTFLTMLSMKPGQLMAGGGAKKHLEEHQVEHIRIVPARLEDATENGEMLQALIDAAARGGSGAGPGDGPRGGAGGRGAGSGAGGPGTGGPGGGPGTGGPGGGPGAGGPGTGGPGGGAAGPGGGSGKGGAGIARPGGETGGGPGPGGTAAGRGPTAAVENLQAFLASLAGSSGAPADVGGLPDYLESMGLDRQGMTPNTQGMLTRAVTSMEPAQRLSVLMGSADLRPGPLRGLFSRLAGTMAAPTLASAFAQGSLEPREVAGATTQLKKIVANAQDWVSQAAEALRRGGMSSEQLEELVSILNWESRPVEERIRELLKGERIFELPAEKVLAFLRELLEAGQTQEFLRLVRHFATGLVVPAVARRQATARAFETIAGWVRIPGMPPAAMDDVASILTHAYGREKSPEVLATLSAAMEHLLWFLMESGRASEAAAQFTVLQDLEEEENRSVDWKAQATLDLLKRLGTAERMDQLLARMFLLERAAAAEQIHPSFALLGPPAAAHLVERLAQEHDRGRRGRIIECLRSCGHLAEGPLLEALKSGEWFVIRNSLLMLAEVAGPERAPQLEPFLDHPDGRVRLTAVRALGRIGGRAAETALTRLLASAGPDLQLEVMYFLDELKVRNAVPALLQLLKPGKGRNRSEQDKVREKALEVLGHLGSSSIIPDLAEVLARRKGFFRDAREPLPARVCALRALGALGTPESREAIRKALALEPPGHERDALEKALGEAGIGGGTLP